MQYVYDPFVIRRGADGRIFTVSPKMPFEWFVQCFHAEQPFFLVSQLEDGRVAITPNVSFIPFNLLKTEYWPQDLLPRDYEYVTMKKETYPVIMSAHPVARFDEWYRNFQSCVATFAKQSLGEFVATSPEFLPLEVGAKPSRAMQALTA
jgi:hypothetical protein